MKKMKFSAIRTPLMTGDHQRNPADGGSGQRSEQVEQAIQIDGGLDTPDDGWIS